MNLADDDFTLFGLPRAQRLDGDELDARRRALQAEIHPDRYAADGAAAQRLAMQWAVRVNAAYQRLKDPIQRAAYLCELAGVAVDAERDTAMPADFLAHQMAWHEALAEATTPGDVRSLQADVARDEAERRAALARLLDDDRDAAAAARQVRALMFVARLRRAIDARLDEFEAR